MVKVNPLARWTQSDIDDYIERHDILTNPLLADGFASVGCFPCTRRTGSGEDSRGGRWAGKDKNECGTPDKDPCCATPEACKNPNGNGLCF